MTKTIKTEYQVRPLDDFGDCIEPHFFDSQQEARDSKEELSEMYPEAVDWLFEQNIRVYEGDGELIDETYHELEW